MADKSTIEWTDATWNPIRGCSRVSPGCGGPNHAGGCYAEKIAARFSGPGQPFEGFAERTQHGGRWTGKMALVEEALTLPLRWRKPRRIFVNSMSDLFHEALPDEAIDRVFAVMALAPQHTFQLLTKRAERMRRYMTTSAQTIDDAERRDDIVAAAFAIRNQLGERRGEMWFTDEQCFIQRDRWPLPNVWLGTTVENQAMADLRIPILLSIPAKVRFLSCEPLLEMIAIERYLHNTPLNPLGLPIAQVIAGGESGPRSRPFHLSWAESLHRQCDAAGTAFFLKQLGAEAYDDRSYIGSSPRFETRDRKGGDMTEWPEDLRVREFPT